MWAGLFFFVLVAFAGGGGLGFFLDAHVVDHASMFLAAAIALALRAMWQPKAVNPTSGGLIG